MAARGNSSVKPQKISHGIVRALGSAALEWLLIVLLYIDAIFSYLIIKFAHHCNLQTPCLLCSRFDHILGNEKLKYYRDLICHNHKLEISSLVFCHAHNKLIDVCGMCENCLLSLATVNKSNADEDSIFRSDENIPPEGHQNSQSGTRHCFCCNAPWIARGNAQKLIPSKSSGSDPAKVDVPLLGADEHNEHFVKRSKNPSMVFKATHPKGNGRDHPFHVGYTELKVNSDTESEVLLSDDDDDDDDASAQTCEIDGAKENLAAQYGQLEPRNIFLSHDLAQEKSIDPLSAPELSLPVSQVNSDVIEPITAVGYRSENLNWEQVDIKADPSALTNLISLDDVPPSPKAENTSMEVSNEKKLISDIDVFEGKISSDALEENVPFHLDVPPSSKSKESPTVVTKESKLMSLDEVSQQSDAIESSIDVSEECLLISLNNAPPLATAEKASIDASEESRLLVDDTLSLSNVGKTSVDASKENELIYPDAPSSPRSKESPTSVCKEDKFISLDEISLPPIAVESSLDVSDDRKLISPNDASPSEFTKKTSTDVSNESKCISIDHIPPSILGNTFTDVSKENELISLDVTPSSEPNESLIDVPRESKFISIDEVSLPSNAIESVDVSEECKMIPLNDASPSYSGNSPSEVPEDNNVIFLDDGLQPSDAMESPSEAWKESCVTGSAEHGEIEREEVGKARSVPIKFNGTSVERNPVSSDTALQGSSLLDLSDAYKVAVANRGKQLSGVLAEHWFGKDSSRISEDLKFLLSQIPAARGFEQLGSDMSPKMWANSEELKTSDSASSNGMQRLQKMISLERNESGFESLDGSSVSEIEGESVVDRLKRQIEHDRNLLSAVYKELEEERNASADSVNQAMAMITRLQEEKASLHMEALQSLRMMEEQAEYDMEALQKTNDLLAEKEKEIQDLVEEVEYYRKKYPNDSRLESIVAELNPDSKEKQIRIDHSEVTSFEESVSAPKDTTIMSSEVMTAEAVKISELEFEDEKLFILQSLKKLEKKLYMFSYNGLYADLANTEYSGNEADKVNDSMEVNCKGDSEVNSGMLNDPNESRRCPLAQECISSLEKPLVTEKITPEICKGSDLVSLENEISDLNERLEALESDQNFLELAMNSLKKGEGGVRFIQEIAYHLRELRRIGIRREQKCD